VAPAAGAVSERVAAGPTTTLIPPSSLCGMQRFITSAAILGALAAAAVPTAATQAAATKGPVVSTATTSLGRILVDSRGHTLYLFGKDSGRKSACSGSCATAWPPLIATAKPRAGTGAEASRLGTTKRADGREQVTYNHHPVYTFVKDTKKGQTNGEGLNAFGGIWDALSAAGAKVVKPASNSGGY
jgi:predicted lipoprotein with Yx(FWY)xxD motif